MALHGVFANDLLFGKGVNSDQAQDDEREEVDMDDADLEEGEIASDDEEETQAEDKVEDKPTAPKVEVKKEDFKSANQSEKPDCIGYKSSGTTTEKRRDKRVPSNNSNNSRGRKRTGEDDIPSHRDSHRKRRRTHDGDNDEMEEADYDVMNVRGHSPMDRLQRFCGGGESAGSDCDDNVNPSSLRRQRGVESRSRPGRNSPARRRPPSGNNRDRGGGDRRRQDRDRSDRDRRPAKNNPSNSSSNKIKEESICAFYMEGKCSRGNDCPYSHAALPPRKMELCKFYLMDCCAKKEKCLYLHKDFPCKFFHTGKKCRSSAEECKFSHDPLSDTMRAILIKHIETAPREILGDFPRLTREETIEAIDHFSPLPNGREKRPHIPALFEQSVSSGPASKPDVKDPPKVPNFPQDRNEDPSSRRPGFYQDMTASEAEPSRGEQPEENSRSIWFGQLRQEKGNERSGSHNPAEEYPRERVEEPHRSPLVAIKEEEHRTVDYLSTLPARQRQLYRRIQQQQREPASTHEEVDTTNEKNSLDDKWYSSDEEGNGESITDLLKSIKQKPEVQSDKDGSGAALNTLNLSSLENINVAEIAKALSTLQQSQSSPADSGPSSVESSSRRDPRTRDPRVRGGQVMAPVGMGDIDLRVSTSSRQDVDLRLDNRIPADVDLRSGLLPLGNLEDIGSSDIDLRRLAIPFKSTVVHTPVREIEASVTCRPPMEYQVFLVDYVPLDYSQIRVQADWAHLDPRQQKGSASVRDFTSTDHTPAIPLGPASPDPIPIGVRHYEQEPAATTYSPLRSGPNDPRARDPRRATVSQSTTSQHAEKRGISGVGLLGAAPPGMLPILSKASPIDISPQETSYSGFRQMNTSYVDRNVIDELPREQQSRQVENRRDPRQRHKNPPITDSTERSYTPPPNERVFR